MGHPRRSNCGLSGVAHPTFHDSSGRQTTVLLRWNMVLRSSEATGRQLTQRIEAAGSKRSVS